MPGFLYEAYSFLLTLLASLGALGPNSLICKWPTQMLQLQGALEPISGSTDLVGIA